MNLLTFPPVCLPSQGQSFGGMDGVVAGNSQSPKIQEIYQRYDFLSPESLGFVVGITSLGICTKIRFYGTHFSYHLEIHVAFSFSGWGHSEESAHHSTEILRDVKVVFCHRPNSLNLLPHQVPIATKSACEKNVEENGHSFDQNTVCAGGNGKGTCQVFKGTLLFLLFFSCKNPTYSGPFPHEFFRFYQPQKEK